jgi:hypothetical protein
VNAITSKDWRATIMAFLRGHFVPEDEKVERRMAHRARNYTIINEDLYRRGVCVHHFSNAYPEKKAENYAKKLTPGCVHPTSAQELL